MCEGKTGRIGEKKKETREIVRNKEHHKIIVHLTSSQAYEKGTYNILQRLPSLYIKWNSFIISLWRLIVLLVPDHAKKF